MLVDGFGAARWRLFETRSDARLRIEPFRRLTKQERTDVQAEAVALAGFS